MKRTRYTVRVGNEVAKFSDLEHAQRFAENISFHSQTMLEVEAKDGLVGQYLNGYCTPEFLSHSYKHFRHSFDRDLAEGV